MLSDLVAKDMAFIWVIPKTNNIDQKALDILTLFKHVFESSLVTEADEINKLCKDFCKDHNVKYATFMKLMRSILTGLQVSFSLENFNDLNLFLY